MLHPAFRIALLVTAANECGVVANRRRGVEKGMEAIGRFAILKSYSSIWLPLERKLK